MARPNPIEYAERLYAAIRTANFSPISFLAFGNAIKDGVELRRMPRIAAEPFMRVVGDMLELEHEITDADVIRADILSTAAAESRAPASRTGLTESLSVAPSTQEKGAAATQETEISPSPDGPGR